MPIYLQLPVHNNNPWPLCNQHSGITIMGLWTQKCWTSDRNMSKHKKNAAEVHKVWRQIQSKTQSPSPEFPECLCDQRWKLLQCSEPTRQRFRVRKIFVTLRKMWKATKSYKGIQWPRTRGGSVRFKAVRRCNLSSSALTRLLFSKVHMYARFTLCTRAVLQTNFNWYIIKQYATIMCYFITRSGIPNETWELGLARAVHSWE